MAEASAETEEETIRSKPAVREYRTASAELVVSTDWLPMFRIELAVVEMAS